MPWSGATPAWHHPDVPSTLHFHPNSSNSGLQLTWKQWNPIHGDMAATWYIQTQRKKQKPWSLAVSVKSSTMRRRYWSHPWHFGKTKPKQIGGQVDAGWRSTASKNIENSRLCTKISKDVFGMMGPPLQLFQELGSKISQVTAFGVLGLALNLPWMNTSTKTCLSLESL